MKRFRPLPPTRWTRYRPALCRACVASCCRGWPVEASVTDLIRLGLMADDEACGSLTAVARRLKSEGIIRRYRRASMIFVLAQKPNGDCVFLDDNRRCRVYAKRPEICRQFPRIGPRPGHCPYIAKSESGEAP